MPEAGCDFDVVVIGGGPAGCAAAVSLLKHDRPCRVAIFDAGIPSRDSIGETLQPGVREVLEYLGAWEPFLADQHLEAYGSAAAWGNAESHENEFLFSRERIGWHLNRQRFDAGLRAQARQCGVVIHEGERLVAAERVRSGWQLRFAAADGSTRAVNARFAVDATGRSARLAGFLGVRKVAIDGLRAAVVFCPRIPGDEGTYLQIEATEQGWWYTARIPGERRVIAFMTEHEKVKELGLSQGQAYEKLLRQTAYISRHIRKGDLALTPIVRSAATQRLDEFAGSGWLAVGDAACAHDPLSSRGIHHALRTGIMAGHAVYDHFIGNPAGMLKYQASLTADFEAFLDQRRHYYREEQRWPDSRFWRERHCPVTLDPEATLVLADREVAERELTRRPKWLRPFQWRELLTLLVEPRPAHEVVRRFVAQSAERLMDWRVVEAIQQLHSVRAVSLESGRR